MKIVSNHPSEAHDDNILDDYPVLPATQVDDTYKRVSKWFGVGLILIIIILICL